MFLTEIEPRLAVRGSRDPLGLVPIWGHFGRQVVGNLTTVTDSVRGFTTLLMGHAFARQVQDLSKDEPESTLALFIKFEQFAGYSRYAAAKDGAFRGVDRVKRSLAEGGTVILSASTDHQILADQKTYGLWGLYSTAARGSGLLHRTEVGLTFEAREFVERQYLEALTLAGQRDGRSIVEILRRRDARFDVTGKHAALAKVIAQLLGSVCSDAEREFYRRRLVEGGDAGSTAGVQRLAGELMQRLPPNEPFSRRALRALVKESRRHGELGEKLADRLQRIDCVESVLIPAASAFGLMQARNAQKLSTIAHELDKAWGPLSHIDVEAIRGLRADLDSAAGLDGGAERWIAIAQGLAEGDFADVLNLLVDQNALVMQTRHGSQPWVRVEHGVLDVRFRDEATDLPSRRELPVLWYNNYFLNSLKTVVDELREP